MDQGRGAGAARPRVVRADGHIDTCHGDCRAAIGESQSLGCARGMNGLVPNAREVGLTVPFAVGGAEIWISTAPTSKAFRFPGSGRAFPKKSVLGGGAIRFSGSVVVLTGT